MTFFHSLFRFCCLKCVKITGVGAGILDWHAKEGGGVRWQEFSAVILALGCVLPRFIYLCQSCLSHYYYCYFSYAANLNLN